MSLIHISHHKNAYMCFYIDTRKKIVKMNTTLTGREIIKQIAQMWSNLDNNEKMVYNEMSKKDAERYTNELRLRNYFEVIISNDFDNFMSLFKNISPIDNIGTHGNAIKYCRIFKRDNMLDEIYKYYFNSILSRDIISVILTFL